MVQSSGFDTVDFREVRGKHDPFTADKVNAALNGFQGGVHAAAVAGLSGACKLPRSTWALERARKAYGMRQTEAVRRRSGGGLPVVAAGEVFFHPDVEDDEEVAAAHFFDFEFGDAVAAVAPGDGDDRKIVAADDGFEGEFDGDVEVRGEDGADAVDDFFAVGFEGVGGVVKAVAEEESHEGVGQAVHEKFDRRVIDGAAAFHEAAAEDAVVAFVEFFPVTDDVAAVVGFIGHEDDRGIAGHGVEAEGNRSSKTMRTLVLDRAENGWPFSKAET